MQPGINQNNQLLKQIGEQEHKKANQKMNTVIYLPRFEITTHDPYVSVEVA
jgi:hypothetical protein